MVYMPVPVFPVKGKRPEMHQPTSDCTLHVVRTMLFGSVALGNKGIYHHGLLMKTDDAIWVLDLSIQGAMSSLIPYLDKNGNVTIDNLIVIGYYPPSEHDQWGDYWQFETDPICTISASLYHNLAHYLIDIFSPTHNRYDIFMITDKPHYNITGDIEHSWSTIFASPNTCDKLPLAAFEWLHKHHSVSIKEFPIERIVLETEIRPEKITNMKDPGLVAYAREMSQYINVFKDIDSHNYKGLFEAISTLSKHVGIPFLQYVVALDPKTKEQHFYKMNVKDLAVSGTDVFYQFPTSQESMVARTQAEGPHSNQKSCGSNGCEWSWVIPVISVLGSLLLVALLVIIYRSNKSAPNANAYSTPTSQRVV
jgi:hypothetical protein